VGLNRGGGGRGKTAIRGGGFADWNEKEKGGETQEREKRGGRGETGAQLARESMKKNINMGAHWQCWPDWGN